MKKILLEMGFFTRLCDWDVPNLRRLKNCLWLNQAGF